MTSLNSFGAAGQLHAGGRTHQIFRLAALEKTGVDLARIPYSIKILLENLLRFEDGTTVKRSDIEYVAQWDTAAPARERDQLPSGSRDLAGFYRSAVRCRSRGDARRA